MITIIATALVCAVYALFWRKSYLQQGPLKKVFKGKTTLLGRLSFSFKGREFSLLQVSAGGGTYGTRGSYPVLSVEIPSFWPITITTLQAKKYLFIGDFPKGHHSISLDDKTYVLISASEKTLLRAEEFIKKRSPHLLFQSDWAHLKVKNEIHIEGPTLLKRKTVLSYVGLPGDIYERPEELKVYLEKLSQLIEDLFLENAN